MHKTVHFLLENSKHFLSPDLTPSGRPTPQPLHFSVSSRSLWCGRLCVQVCNMFIVSLAIADLIVGLVVMPMSTVYIFTVDWWFGVGLCQLWIGVDYTASTASILNLFILSLDRYWSVTMPLKYLRKRTTKRALIMISLVLKLGTYRISGSGWPDIRPF